ncbi:cell filamentation protein Fic [Candidatus Marinamargulisbacteria bacterium SCGC AAA071-K20]|nr:cell filamentation protein Fic [Candidatus Marinamargulisbacteria bacterium SCGC AAA071-K20]
MSNKLNVYKKIQVLRERYIKSSVGKEALLQLITETEIAEHVYNSNAIENSTLTLEETEKILLQIDLERFISERELFEAKNLARVVSYIDKKAMELPLTLDLILMLHKMLLSNIRDDIAGRLREGNEYVRVANHIAPPPKELDSLLSSMLQVYNSNVYDSIISRIATAHLSFEYAHPFVDGNGRIGRLINNYLLIRDGYVPINIKYIDRKTYYDALRAFDVSGETRIMEEIVGRALTNSYHKRLAYLEGKKIITLNEFSKQNKLSHANLINKAKRQTIETFMEKGVWKIGVL